MAIAFCLTKPFMTSVIIGATTMEQLKANIAAADVTDFYKHTCDLWVYNPAPLPGKKATFQFLSSSGTVQYYFDFYLDYSGWRRAVRSYKYDMDGPASSASFNRVRIVGPTNVSGQLFFDAVTWVGPRFTRDRDLQNIDIADYFSAGADIGRHPRANFAIFTRQGRIARV